MTDLVAGRRVLRPRPGHATGARTGRQLTTVVGDWTYLPANGEPAFKLDRGTGAGGVHCLRASCRALVTTAVPSPAARSATCHSSPGIQSPAPRATTCSSRATRASRTWIDYAYTRIPAYAPRLFHRLDRLCRRDDALLLGRTPGREPERQRGPGGAAHERPAELLRSSPRPADPGWARSPRRW